MAPLAAVLADRMVLCGNLFSTSNLVRSKPGIGD